MLKFLFARSSKPDNDHDSAGWTLDCTTCTGYSYDCSDISYYDCGSRYYIEDEDMKHSKPPAGKQVQRKHMSADKGWETKKRGKDVEEPVNVLSAEPLGVDYCLGMSPEWTHFQEKLEETVCGPMECATMSLTSSKGKTLKARDVVAEMRRKGMIDDVLAEMRRNGLIKPVVKKREPRPVLREVESIQTDTPATPNGAPSFPSGRTRIRAKNIPTDSVSIRIVETSNAPKADEKKNRSLLQLFCGCGRGRQDTSPADGDLNDGRAVPWLVSDEGSVGVYSLVTFDNGNEDVALPKKLEDGEGFEWWDTSSISEQHFSSPHPDFPIYVGSTENYMPSHNHSVRDDHEITAPSPGLPEGVIKAFLRTNIPLEPIQEQGSIADSEKRVARHESEGSGSVVRDGMATYYERVLPEQDVEIKLAGGGGLPEDVLTMFDGSSIGQSTSLVDDMSITSTPSDEKTLNTLESTALVSTADTRVPKIDNVLFIALRRWMGKERAFPVNRTHSDRKLVDDPRKDVSTSALSIEPCNRRDSESGPPTDPLEPHGLKIRIVPSSADSSRSQSYHDSLSEKFARAPDPPGFCMETVSMTGSTILDDQRERFSCLDCHCA